MSFKKYGDNDSPVKLLTCEELTAFKSIVIYLLAGFDVERREGGSSRCESMTSGAVFMVGQ